MKTRKLRFILNTVVLLFLLVSCGCISSSVVIKTEGIFYSNPSFSPAGNKILFQGKISGNLKIFTCNVTGEDMKLVINDSGNYLEPVWGKDSSTILFVSDRNRQYDLFRYGIDDNAIVNLTNTKEFDENYASYSKDMNNIIFLQAVRDKNYGDYGYSYKNLRYIISDTSGKNRSKLSDDPPVFSFDGLYFLAGKDIDRNTSEIWINSLDGKIKRKITDGANPISWTPDGRSFFYNDLVDGELIITFINIDGTGKKRLFRGFYYFNNIRNYNSWYLWDPSGSCICIPVTAQKGYMNNNGLVILDTSGNVIRDLRETDDVFYYGEKISWSPDGKMIVFSKNRGYPYPYQGGIYTINSDGTGQKIIVQDDASYRKVKFN